MSLKPAVGAFLATLFCLSGSAWQNVQALGSQPAKDGCFVSDSNPRRGGTAQWHMIVVNDGAPCEIRRDVPGAPATRITVRVKPENGVLSVEAPFMRYTPKANFTGEDVFEVEWVGLEWTPYFPVFFNTTTRATISVTIRAKGAEASPAQ